MILDWLQSLGQRALSFFQRLGRGHITLYYLLISIPSVLMRPRLLLQQVYSVGVLTLLIILVSGLFVGMVLGLQGYNTLARFGAEQALGTAVALTLVREMAPVVTALLFAGRAGSALTAEIGLMKATEQLSGMEMMAVDPNKRVLAPRFLAGVIAMPLLVAIFTSIGIFGAWLVGVALMGVDVGSFWSQMQANVGGEEIFEGVFKSIVFGITASLVAVYEGYRAWPTAEGVGRATTRTVVLTAVAVLILDYMITAALL